MVDTLTNEYTEGDEPYADRMEAKYRTATTDIPDTYINLHKDILLTIREDKKFDRVVQSGDFVVVTGVDSLAAGIRFKLQTFFGELNELPNYQDFGNKAWFYLKRNNTELDRLDLKEAVKEALNEMRRIRQVEAIDLQQVYPEGLLEPATIVIDGTVMSISDNFPTKIQEVFNYGI